MPRRRKKKLTPEQIKEAYETWKTEEDGEYAHLLKMKEIIEDLKLTEVKDINKDLFQKTEPYLVEFQKMGAIFKVKKCRKFKKPVTQIAIRTAIFGGKLLMPLFYHFFIILFI